MKKVLYFLFLSWFLVACQYSEVRYLNTIVGINKPLNSYSFVTIIEHKIYQKAKGIAAFPNGGKAKILEHHFVIYDANAKTRQVLPRLTLKDPWQNMHVSTLLIGKLENNGTLYVEIDGNKDKHSIHKYLKIDKNGQYRKISKSQMQWGGNISEAMFPKKDERHFLRLSTSVNPPGIIAWMDPSKTYKPGKNFHLIFEIDEKSGKLLPIK